MIEPLALLKIELSPRLTALIKREGLYQLLPSHHFSVIPRVPPQEGKEIDNSLGQVTTLTVPHGNGLTLRVVPLEREYGEAQSIAISLAELTIPFGLE